MPFFFQGNRLAAASGRDIGGLEDETVGEPGGKKHQFIAEILRWRAQATAEHVLFSLLNSRGVATQTLTCSQLHKKVGRNRGDCSYFGFGNRLINISQGQEMCIHNYFWL